MASFRKEFSLDKLELTGKLISILEEPGAEGNFVVNYFVWESLREQDSSCCLLSMKHVFNHYFHIGLKLGYNLSTHKSRAIVYEALNACFKDSSQCDANELEEIELKRLFLILVNKCEYLLEQYKKVFLIIDDITIFLSLGFSLKAILIFCHYLRTLQSRDITVVILVHYSENDQESWCLKSFIEHVSDIKFKISSLRTGTAEDISGSVAMTRKSSSLENYKKSILYHYKLTERNIKLFPPGSI